MASLVLWALVGAGVPEGSDRMVMRAEETQFELYTYKPAGYRDGPMILVFHGVLRNADEYRDHARGMGDRFGALIVAPRFSREDFPSEKYQQGGLRRDGVVQPPERWTWRFIPRMVAELRKREERPEMPFYMIGHSGGGQFLLRMAGFVSTGAERIVVANAGTVLLPDSRQSFPYGFGGLPEALSGDEAMRRYLAQPVTIYLGSSDTERDEYLDTSPDSDRQGKNRWERGQAVYQAGAQLAKERGWTFGWRLVVADGIEHDHEKMFDHPSCRQALFGP